ncbi:MAG: MarR family transcriptional regulator [Clostridia bacterium]|nr:MarR family transcriptional regulator [Clostridia bacterium]
MLDRFERFSFAIAEISKYWHKIAAEEMGRHGLKSSHATYLTTMSRKSEGLTAPEICEICGRDKADVSRMMAILEKKGLVTKKGGNQNMYRGLWTLTEEGERVALHIRERAEKAVAIAGHGVSEEHRTIFYDTIDKITLNLRKMSKEGY